MLRAGLNEEYRVQSNGVHQSRAARAPSGAALLILGAAVVSGCASQPRASGAWVEGAPRDRSYQRVLVVGVSPSIDQRCPFERYLASRIKSANTTAIVSCDVVDRKAPLTRESIEAAIASQKADAVVATNLVSKKWDAEEGGSRDTRGGGMYKATDAGYATGYYGAYGVPVVYGEFQTASSITTLQGEVEVQTRVYETQKATVVYSLDTVAKKLESRGAGLDALTSAIADRLRRDGLVR
jgi:hypothetical protein